MRPSLINLMVRLSLKEGGGESIIELVLIIHIFHSAIKEKLKNPQIDRYDQCLIYLVMIIRSVKI